MGKDKVNINNFKYEEPFCHDYHLIRKKGLMSSVKNEPADEYFVLYNKYKKMFSQYIIGMTSIRTIEKGFQTAAFHFSPIKKVDMDFYQTTDYMGFEYLFLRNNFYVENLPNADIRYLKNCSNEDYDFIERTFRTVINRYAIENGFFKKLFNSLSDMKLNKKGYEYKEKKDLHAIKDILIGIGFEKYKANNIDENEREKVMFNRKLFVNQITDNIENGIKEELHNPVKAIKYVDVISDEAMNEYFDNTNENELEGDLITRPRTIRMKNVTQKSIEVDK